MAKKNEKEVSVFWAAMSSVGLYIVFRYVGLGRQLADKVKDFNKIAIIVAIGWFFTSLRMNMSQGKKPVLFRHTVDESAVPEASAEEAEEVVDEEFENADAELAADEIIAENAEAVVNEAAEAAEEAEVVIGDTEAAVVEAVEAVAMEAENIAADAEEIIEEAEAPAETEE